MSMPIAAVPVLRPTRFRWLMTVDDGAEVLSRRARREAKAKAAAASEPPASEIDLNELYRTSYHDMVRLARQFVDDVESAQDVVHDAFLGLHRNQDRIENPANARAYLRASVLNHARSALRRRRTAREYVAAAEPEAGPSADEPLLLAEEHSDVLVALDALPARMKEVLVLRYWENLSEQEIASTLNISPGTVKSQASRGLAKLAEAMRGRL